MIAAAEATVAAAADLTLVVVMRTAVRTATATAMVTLLRSFPSISWQVPRLVPTYHSLKQYFALGCSTLSSSCSRYPIPTSTEFFYAMHLALSDYVEHIERNKVFTIDFSSDKRSPADC